VSPGRLVILLSGEPVTITGHRRLEVDVGMGADAAGEAATWGQLLRGLGRAVHPWFAELADSGGDMPGLGPVLLLYGSRRLALPAALEEAAGPGMLHIIPPIPGG
jgi:hypothetical protein